MVSPWDDGYCCYDYVFELISYYLSRLSLSRLERKSFLFWIAIAMNKIDEKEKSLLSVTGFGSIHNKQVQFFYSSIHIYLLSILFRIRNLDHNWKSVIQGCCEFHNWTMDAKMVASSRLPILWQLMWTLISAVRFSFKGFNKTCEKQYILWCVTIDTLSILHYLIDFNSLLYP